MEYSDVISSLYARTEPCEVVSVHYENGTARMLVVADNGYQTDEIVALHQAVDRMSDKCEARLELLVLRHNDLEEMVADGPGNDAKFILGAGTTIRGRAPAIRGSVEPPDPTQITEDEFEYNMWRYGFDLMRSAKYTMPETALVRPEYVIAGVLFGMHDRRISSGIPVMMNNARISYGLLVYLARSYRFAGRLLGIMLEMRSEGRLVGVIDEPITILERCGTIPKKQFEGTVGEALRVYGC